MPITNVENLRKSPGFLLRCAHQFAVAIVAEHFTPLGLTATQFAALVAINDHPGLDITRLAMMTDFDRPMMTGVIDRLEAKGLLVRELDPHDRRARQLFLTRVGKKILAEADRSAHKSRDVLLDPLPAAERKQFMVLLEKLVELHWKRDTPSVQARADRVK